MAATDPDALACDFAEEYNIYDWGQLPVKTAAALAFGLRPNSRIKMQLSGQPVTNETLLLAIIADNLSILRWQNTKDGQRGRNQPKLLSNALLGEGETKEAPEEKIRAFESPEDFEAERKRILAALEVKE